ncbi:helix-turn-helix domain-containing protein [Salinibacterium sp. G-O1]|uniref:ArsR/SmtB family transcription factor n=1 Tax=Salinibacterium sp. G-O1 TaxID=3046208 RepID=UPI0024B8CE4E|nr:helix-turn-helix domain-containing protein [Salinibacterium sp. G-O1]MDJ0334958.1 helix-turn-helix domain-containing protein [Salinibacterium sp. G-O1]
MVYSTADIDESSATEALDRVFAALSHPTRRRLVRYLATRASAPRMSQAAQDNGLSPQLLNKHTAALEKAGMVQRVSVGRESMLVIDRAALVEAQKWIVDTRAFWEGQLDSLDAYIDKLASQGELPPTTPKDQPWPN